MTVIVNGAVVPSAPPAALRAGHVVGPVELLARFADRIETAPGGTVIVRRGDRSCRSQAVNGREPALFELAPLARCLGAEHVAWDGPTKTLALTFDGPLTVRTLPPYDPAAPRVAPTTIFTPEPAPATPRVIVTGLPRPRRTAIPVLAPAATTGPRP